MKKILTPLLFLLLLIPLNADITTSLVVHYSFNGNTEDVSGNALHAINSGAVLTEDRFNNPDSAYFFNGTSAHIYRAFDPDLTPRTDDWTVSAFIKPAGQALEGQGAVISWYRCGATAGCNSTDSGVYEITSDTLTSNWRVRTDNQAVAAVNATVEKGKWQLITGVYMNLEDSVRIYLNGNYIGASSANFNSLSDGSVSVPLEMGRVFRTGWGVPGNYFNGSIDDVRIYRRALSVSDIKEICSEGGWMISPEVTISSESISVTLSWNTVAGAQNYKVYSSEDPYSGFMEDLGGTFNGNSWSAPISLSSRKFYYIKAVN